MSSVPPPPAASLLERLRVYLPLGEALEAAGLYHIEHYITVRQNALAVSATTRPILDLWREMEWQSGSMRQLLWWTQGQGEAEFLLVDYIPLKCTIIDLFMHGPRLVPGHIVR